MRLAITAALAVSLLLPSAVAAAPAEFGADLNGPYPPRLVPGGVVVQELVGRQVRINRIDTKTGKRTVLARLPVDRHVDFDYDSAVANVHTSDGRLAVSYAQEYADELQEIHAVEGQILTAGFGDPLEKLHKCAGETSPAPLDIDGTNLVAAERTTCRDSDYGERAKFDIVAHDLATGTKRTLARNVVAGDDAITVAGPYAAVALGDEAFGEGYANNAPDLRVYDLRTGATVSSVRVFAEGGPASIDLTPEGRIVGCGGGAVFWLDPGATQIGSVAIPCDRAQALPGDRVAVRRGRNISIGDLSTGSATRVATTAQAYAPFDTDGDRLAWSDVTCRSDVVRVADLGDPAAGVPRYDRIKCRASISPRLEVRGRNAYATVTCEEGCAGTAQLYEIGGDGLPLVYAPMDPVPGRTTRVRIPLTKALAAYLTNGRRVTVTVSLDHAFKFYSVTARVVRR